MTDKEKPTGNVEQLKTQKEEWFQKQREISEKIVSLINQIKEFKEKRDELTKSVHSKKEERNKINDKIKETISQLRELKPEELNKKSPIPLGKLKKEVDQLEKTIETAGVSFEKEQKLMKSLKEKKKILHDNKDIIERTRRTGKLGKQLRLLKKESDDIHNSIQQMAKESQDQHESLLKLAEEVDKLREHEKEAKDNYGKLRQKLVDSGAISPRPKKIQQPSKKLVSQREEVEEKIKGRKKLTTEDLLLLQGMRKDVDLNIDDDSDKKSDTPDKE